MKLFKIGLRFWITLVSMASFVGGWIMLVHAPKPSPLIQGTANTMPTLEPLPPLGDGNFQSQQIFSVQPRRFGTGFFRTGGS